MSGFKPDHSDFLIHWTGCDLDKQYADKYSSNPPDHRIISEYLERLKFILKHGLWMTKGGDQFEVEGQIIKRPQFWRTSFTELKLSEAKLHAEKFGRLGIGFKRFFLFNRLGSPMCYYRPERHSWFTLPHAVGKKADPNPVISEYWACFLKSMHEGKDKSDWVEYKQFEESEWRIIYSDEIAQKLDGWGHSKYKKYFKKVSEINDNEFQKYVEYRRKITGGSGPGYLISLREPDPNPAQWFSLIIYPHIGVKVAAEADPEIRALIRDLKPDFKKGHDGIGSASYENFSKPIEIDLGACKSF